MKKGVFMISDYSNLVQEWYAAAGSNAGTSDKIELYDKTTDAVNKLNGMESTQKSEQAEIILQTFDKLKADTDSLTQWVASNTDIAGNGAYKVIHDLFDTVKNIKGNTETLTGLDKAMTDSIAKSKEKFKNETPPLVDDLINPIIKGYVKKIPDKDMLNLTEVSKKTQDQVISAYRGKLIELYIKAPSQAIEFVKNHGSKLNFLNISYIKLSSNELKELLEYLPNIKTFIAKGYGLDSEAAKVIANSSNVKNLKILVLAYNMIGAEGAMTLLNSPNLVNMSILGIWRNKLGIEGATGIAESKNLLNLKELHVGGNQIGNAEALEICESLVKNENLINLDLRSNNIYENFALTISKLEPPKNLKVLNLSFNGIYRGTEGFDALYDSEKLKNVKIEFNFTYGWEDNLT